MIAVPYAWLAVFFLIPFVIVLKLSFADQLIAQPPYSSLLEMTEKGYLTLKLNLNNYKFLIEDALYWKAYLNSVKIAFVSACLCLLIGIPWPMAWRGPNRRRAICF